MDPGFATLDPPVDPSRDHVRGPADAPVTLVEYGDFQCPYCGDAYPVVRDLAERFGDSLRHQAETARTVTVGDAFWSGPREER